MPYKFEQTPINNPKHDKRVKLTNEDKENIVKDYETGLFSQRALARKYNISRRMISFILFPEREKVAKEQFKQRQKEGRYYSKDKHRQYMKKHRDHKKELYKKGELKRMEQMCIRCNDPVDKLSEEVCDTCLEEQKEQVELMKKRWEKEQLEEWKEDFKHLNKEYQRDKGVY